MIINLYIILAVPIPISLALTTSVIKMTRYWLLKSEPHEFSINDLESVKQSRWDGIRNYQARNHIREMNINDIAFFYHSSTKYPGIYGSMNILSDNYPDPTAIDKNSNYFDAKATTDINPWLSVDVSFRSRFDNPLLLSTLKSLPLGPCPLTQKGNRLSVIPITEEQYELIIREINSINDTII